MDVNSIVCCGFNKSYSTLPKSRSGSLGNSQLYEAALFAYQNLVFQRHVDMEYSCISESDFDTFSQKLQGCCGCCGVDNDTDTELTLAYQSCPVCFTVVGFTDDPQNDGIYADPDSDIIVIRDDEVFNPFLELVGTGTSPGGINNDFNWTSSTKITSISSTYYDMVAISRTDFGTLESNIQIWDINSNPTPQLVTTFSTGITGDFYKTIYGPIAYDAVNDRVYFTFLDKSYSYLNLGTGLYTIVMVLNSINPSGDVYGAGVNINPVTNKRYVYISGVKIYPPDRGGIAILSPSDVIENKFPYDTIYTTPDPTIDIEFAANAGFVFDNDGYAYTVTSINATDYDNPFTQRDIVKLDPTTNEVVGILNYDLTQAWLPVSGNSQNQSVMQYYDGTGAIPGEKILVVYRNTPPARATFTGTITGTLLDVTSVTSGTILNGTLITGSGILPDTNIVSFGTGTGGVGTYTVDVSQTIGSTSITMNPQTPVGNAFASAGTIARIVAFDTQAPYNSSVLFELPDSTYAGVKRFFYSNQFNKMFVFAPGAPGPNNGTWGLTLSGDVIYFDGAITDYSGYSYQFYDFPASNRVMTYTGSDPITSPDNILVIEPPIICPDGRINVTNEGTYEFNGGEWVPMVQTQNISNFGNQWNVSAVFNQTAVQAKLQYSTNLISWTDIEPVTGGLYHDPTEWLSGLVFVINTDDDIWFRIAIANDEDCLTYGEIFPEPPPSPNFEGSPLTLYRYNDVQFTDLSVGVPQSWAWTFESGTPATSTLENPLITYETAGIFDVTLAATNVNGTLSKTQNNYVTVNDGLLLNFIPDSEVGYSLRKINITYSGPCIRVRRDSDNVENDIFFNGVDLDISSLVAFCSGASGYVVTWYDQSGNTNDLTQLVSAEQPQIVSLGVTLSENGKPCLQFDGSDDNMNMLTAVVVTATSASIVAAHTNISGIRPLVGTSLANQISLAGGLGFGIAAASAFNTFTPSTSTSQGLFTIHRNGLANPNNLSSAYRDGVQLTQGFSTPITTQTGTYTALSGASGANRFTGKVQEVIIWNGYKASKNTVMQNDTNAYYNIY